MLQMQMLEEKKTMIGGLEEPRKKRRGLLKQKLPLHQPAGAGGRKNAVWNRPPSGPPFPNLTSASHHITKNRMQGGWARD